MVGDFDVPVEHPMTPEEVAALLQIDRETVYRMARRGQLPAFKVSSRWRFLPSHLQRWMEGEARPRSVAASARWGTVDWSGRPTPGGARASSI